MPSLRDLDALRASRGHIPAPPERSPFFGHPVTEAVQHLGHAVGEGMTGGFWDEILAKMGIGEGATYEERRQALEALHSRFKEYSAVGRALGTGGEFAGAVGGAVGIPGVVRALAPSTAGAIARWVGKSGTVAGEALRKTGAMAAGGATQAGVYGAGTAQPGERIEGAMTHAPVGGIFGAATAPAGWVAGKGVELARSATEGAAASAKRRFRAKAAESGLTREELIALSREIGGDVIPADLTRGLQKELEVVVARPGPGSQIAETALIKRQELADRRIRNSIVRIVSGGKNWRDAMKTLKSESDAVVGPMYKEIENEPVLIEQAFMDTSSFVPALKQAIATAKDKAVKTGGVSGIDAIEAAIESRTPVTVPLAIADSTKRILYDAEQGLKQAQGLIAPKATEASAAVSGVRRDFVQSLDDQFDARYGAETNPYRAVRQRSQGFERNKEAIQTGRMFDKFTLEELSEKARSMSADEKHHMRLGVALNLRTRVGRGKQARAKLDPSGDDMRRLQITMEGDYPAMEKVIRDEGLFRETKTKALSGSPTAGRLLGAQEQKESMAVADAISRRPSESLFQYGVEGFRSAATPSQQQQAILAEMLTRRGGIEELLGPSAGAGVPTPNPLLLEAIRRSIPIGGVMSINEMQQP